MIILFAPVDTCGDCEGDLTIDSNDPNQPTLHVRLIGATPSPPRLAAEPDSTVDPTKLRIELEAPGPDSPPPVFAPPKN